MIDRTSLEWQAVEKWATEQLAAFRQLNDEPGTDIALTEGLRGRIAILKELLELPNAGTIAADRGQGAVDYGLGTRID